METPSRIAGAVDEQSEQSSNTRLVDGAFPALCPKPDGGHSPRISASEYWESLPDDIKSEAEKALREMSAEEKATLLEGCYFPTPESCLSVPSPESVLLIGLARGLSDQRSGYIPK